MDANHFMSNPFRSKKFLMAKQRGTGQSKFLILSVILKPTAHTRGAIATERKRNQLPYCESRLSIRPRWPSKWRLQQRQKNTEWPLFRPRAKNGNYCSGRVIATAMFSLLELRIVYDSPIIFKPVIYPFFEFLLTSGRRTL